MDSSLNSLYFYILEEYPAPNYVATKLGFTPVRHLRQTSFTDGVFKDANLCVMRSTKVFE